MCQSFHHFRWTNKLKKFPVDEYFLPKTKCSDAKVAWVLNQLYANTVIISGYTLLWLFIEESLYCCHYKIALESCLVKICIVLIIKVLNDTVLKNRYLVALKDSDLAQFWLTITIESSSTLFWHLRHHWKLAASCGHFHALSTRNPFQKPREDYLAYSASYHIIWTYLGLGTRRLQLNKCENYLEK